MEEFPEVVKPEWEEPKEVTPLASPHESAPGMDQVDPQKAVDQFDVAEAAPPTVPATLPALMSTVPCLWCVPILPTVCPPWSVMWGAC